MRVHSYQARGLAVLVVAQMAMLSAPSLAFAQGAQPVPYPELPLPVPYGDTAPPAAPPAVPFVPAVGQDVIVMKNGGILRGTLIDAIPESQARIQLATGEIATVPWPSIQRIEHGSSGSALPSPLPPRPAPARVPARPAPDAPTGAAGATVVVHVEGADGARLESDASDDGTWQTACQAPCDVPVAINANYRIASQGIRQSSTFRLHGQQGDHVTVNVNAGSKGWLVAGIVITPVAALVTLVGALAGIAGSINSAVSAQGCVNSSCAGGSASGNGNLAGAGWITALIGAAATVGGIVLIVSNAKTSVSVDLTGTQAARIQGDAWAHVPSWREGTAAERSGPPVIGGSLWTGRF